ncbi:hypothetical protein KF840_25175 [bacterium]|nr:hypothetical protein [bacterium]
MERRNTVGFTMSCGKMLFAAAALLIAGQAFADIGRPVSRGCPLRFDQPTTGLPRTCLFVGRFNTRDGELIAAFAGNGSAVVVAIGAGDAAPLLFLPAAVNGPTSGTLQRWQEGVEPAAVTGTLTLEDGGRRLRVRAALPEGQAGPPAEFVGYFADMVDSGETVASWR